MAHGRIVIADDHAPTRAVLGELLRGDGWTVIEARDGAELVRIASENHLDAVVTDLSMPRMNGLQAARALRSLDATRALPLVAITARQPTEAQEREIDELFDHLIRKPIEPAELRRRLPPTEG